VSTARNVSEGRSLCEKARPRRRATYTYRVDLREREALDAKGAEVRRVRLLYIQIIGELPFFAGRENDVQGYCVGTGVAALCCIGRVDACCGAVVAVVARVCLDEIGIAFASAHCDHAMIGRFCYSGDRFADRGQSGLRSAKCPRRSGIPATATGDTVRLPIVWHPNKPAAPSTIKGSARGDS